jgi:methylated-DNA-[protein]-cysteine S-methyltransferase
MTEMDGLERALMRRDPEPDRPLPDIGRAAAAAGLLDVAYATFDSPLGRLLLAATPRGLVRLAYLDVEAGEEAAQEEEVLAQLAAKVSPRMLSSPRRLDQPRHELEKYFSGRLRGFETSLDWRLTAGFGRRVLEATARIPFGSHSTYKRVATEAGSPGASRAAGNALGANPLPIIVPCHRVLHSTGGLGGYTGGLDRKRLLLAIESGQQRLT